MIEAELGGRCVVRNTSITCKEGAGASAGASAAALRELIGALARAGRPNREDARTFARVCAGRSRISKFQPCLPDALLDDFLAERVDCESAAKVVALRLPDSARRSARP